jgi:integrase
MPRARKHTGRKLPPGIFTREYRKRDGTISSFYFYEAYPPGLDGRPKREARKASSLQEAIDLQLQWKAEIKRGEAVSANKQLLEDYLVEWWPVHVKRKQLRPSAVDSGKTIIEHRIIPRLGKIPLNKLTEREIDSFVHYLQTKGNKGRPYAAYSIKNSMVILHQALDYARRMRLISRNPCVDVERPEIKAKQEPQWTAEQARRFVAILDGEHYRVLYHVVLSTGLRRGEVLGLRWQDVDLDAGVLNVRQAIVDVNGHLVPGEPKTASGEREAHLHPAVVEMLREHRTQQLEQRVRIGAKWVGAGKSGDLVFTTPRGKTIRPTNVWRRLQQLAERAGLAPIGLHGLRRTWSSMAHDGTHDILAVAKAAGHAHPETTVRHYARAADDAAARVSDAVGKALYGS